MAVLSAIASFFRWKNLLRCPEKASVKRLPLKGEKVARLEDKPQELEVLSKKGRK